ncbi:unnamed protein product [Rotaria sp. Silwood2]|nr:unnamed protein product [Rotaria sp. Silwood2]
MDSIVIIDVLKELHIDNHQIMNHQIDDHIYNSSSRSDSPRSSTDSITQNHQISYAILILSTNSNELADCQIIIVNVRKRFSFIYENYNEKNLFIFDRDYAKEIEAHLCCHALRTSIIFLREDYTLTEDIENVVRSQFLYGIIEMPMHEERRTASFHILYG